MDNKMENRPLIRNPTNASHIFLRLSPFHGNGSAAIPIVSSGHADGSAFIPAVMEFELIDRYLSECSREKIGNLSEDKMLVGLSLEKIELCLYLPDECPKCCFCNKVFADSKALIEHLISTRRNPNVKIVSPINYWNSVIQPLVGTGIGPTQDFLEEYSRNVLEPSDKMIIIGEHNVVCSYFPGEIYECLYCNRKFENAEALMSHLILTRQNRYSGIVPNAKAVHLKRAPTSDTSNMQPCASSNFHPNPLKAGWQFRAGNDFANDGTIKTEPENGRSTLTPNMSNMRPFAEDESIKTEPEFD